jgi:CRISPR-associated protein Cas2
MNKPLYIVAYDIASNTRRRLVLKLLKQYSTGGQKSVFECFLSPAEKRGLALDLAQIIHLTQDRFTIIQVSRQVVTLGKAVTPIDPEFFYIG